MKKVRDDLEKKEKNNPFKLKLWYCIKTSPGECKHGPFKKEKARDHHEIKKHSYDRHKT